MNRCPCENPPGGETVCEDNQIAMCIVENGVARHMCLNVSELGSNSEILNSVLSNIFKHERSWNQEITPSDMVLLSQGSFKYGRKNFTFKLNDKVKKALVSHIKNSSEDDDLIFNIQ